MNLILAIHRLKKFFAVPAAALPPLLLVQADCPDRRHSDSRRGGDPFRPDILGTCCFAAFRHAGEYPPDTVHGASIILPVQNTIQAYGTERSI